MINLSADERKHTVKFRPGGEKIVALLAELAARHGVTLPSISVEGMTADLQLAGRLQPVADALAAAAQTVADTILEAQSECWWAATASLTALARMTSADPKLEAALRPAVDFFAVGRRVKKPA